MDERTETPYARAWREWQDSPEGQMALNCNTLNIPVEHVKYFVNRIKAAFDAGWNANKEQK